VCDLLRGWDFDYSYDSKGAVVFEELYHFLLNEWFGKRVFGEEPWKTISLSSVRFDYFYYFDTNMIKKMKEQVSSLLVGVFFISFQCRRKQQDLCFPISHPLTNTIPRLGETPI